MMTAFRKTKRERLRRWEMNKHVRCWNKRRHRFKNLNEEQLVTIHFWLKASSYKKHPEPFNKRRAGEERRATRLFIVGMDTETIVKWDRPRATAHGKKAHWNQQKGRTMFFWQPEWM